MVTNRHNNRKIKIPNMEVGVAFRTIVKRWFEQNKCKKRNTRFTKSISKK